MWHEKLEPEPLEPDVMAKALAAHDAGVQERLQELTAAVEAARPLQWWHLWAGELPEREPGEGSSRVHVVLGPTAMGPDDVGMDGKGIKIRDRVFPFSLVEDDPAKRGPELTYLGSFNHEPDDDDDIEPLKRERGL